MPINITLRTDYFSFAVMLLLMTEFFILLPAFYVYRPFPPLQFAIVL